MIEQILNNNKQIFGHTEQSTENLDTQRFVTTDYCITKAEQYTNSAAAHLYFAKGVR